MDLFKDKIASSSISNYFSDFTSDPTDLNVASKFFWEKFRALNRNPDKEIYIHFTNATDTSLLKDRMTSVQDSIIQRNLYQVIL